MSSALAITSVIAMRKFSCNELTKDSSERLNARGRSYSHSWRRQRVMLMHTLGGCQLHQSALIPPLTHDCTVSVPRVPPRYRATSFSNSTRGGNLDNTPFWAR